MCEEESDDHEAVAKLFEINDSIHRTIERYKLVKKGDIEGANAIAKGTLGISGAGVRKGANNELSLIDFGGVDDEQPSADPSSASVPPPPPPKGNALEDDLLGLSIGPGDEGFGSGGALSLGAPSNGLADLTGSGPSASSSHKPRVSASDILSQFNTPLPSAQPSHNAFASIQQPTPTPASPQTNLFSPAPSQAQQHAPPQQKADPFASLAGSSRTASPFQFQQSFKPPPTSGSPAPAGKAASRPISLISNGDDDWAFSSALPPQQAESKDIQVTDSSIKAVFTVSRPPGANDWLAVESKITNNTQQPITELTFQLAVTKVCITSFFFTLLL